MLVFVYEKADDESKKAANMKFPHAVFVDQSRTADYQTTKDMCDILDRAGNKDDVIAFLIERNLPFDEIGRDKLADRILKTRPALGYLTISNALQWRLQYSRIIDQAGKATGLEDLLHAWDLGDFQTPALLADKILRRLSVDGCVWTRALEPTCGRGNFIQALLHMSIPPKEIIGLEIRHAHIAAAKALIDDGQETPVAIRLANIFQTDLQRELAWRSTGPLLVVGNPPWVTNAEL